ncbi:MAG: 30S ribosomal protein S17 [Candidatus Diapherotrites archaeon]|nr:30S ribosomal protein S17 [Candidatus Diapherotrites archaeon]
MAKTLVIGGEVLKPPEGVECNDKKCPYHGDVRVRGQVLVGKVISDRMDRTVTILREGVVYVPKYERYMRVSYKLHAHNPPCINAKAGDIVLVGETRKLAKTVSFVVLKVIKRAGEGGEAK